MDTAAHVYEAFEYDLSLTAEQLQIRDTARRFATEVLRPAGIAIDRMTPEAAIAPGSPLYSVISPGGGARLYQAERTRRAWRA